MYDKNLFNDEGINEYILATIGKQTNALFPHDCLRNEAHLI